MNDRSDRPAMVMVLYSMVLSISEVVMSSWQTTALCCLQIPQRRSVGIMTERSVSAQSVWTRGDGGYSFTVSGMVVFIMNPLDNGEGGLRSREEARFPVLAWMLCSQRAT